MLDNELVIASAPWWAACPMTRPISFGRRAGRSRKELGRKGVKNSRFLWTDASELQQAMASGEIVAAYAWNDVVKNLTKEGIPVAYAKPKEGYFTWFCGLTLLNTGKADPALAYDFIDAWLSPETGKTLIEGSGYGHANMKSFEIADPDDVKAMGIHRSDRAHEIRHPVQDPHRCGAERAEQGLGRTQGAEAIGQS